MRFSFGVSLKAGYKHSPHPMCLLILLATPSLSAQTPAPDKKQQEAKAKQLVAEGKALEQQGRLAEAKDKYVDSLGVISTGEALDAVHHINEQVKQQVESLLAEGHRLFDAAKFSETAQQLQHGLELFPQGPILHYNLALSYEKQGDRANAAQQLNLAAFGVTNKRENADLLEDSSSVLIGTSVSPFPDEAKKNLETFNESYLQEDRDPSDTKSPDGSLCEQTKNLENKFPGNPAVVFNAAKCAVEDAKPEDAARQLSAYVKLAPDALDRADVEHLQTDLASLAGLPGDSGQLVRQHYATAARYLDYRRYDRAIAEYEAAAQTLPDHPQTQWQIGLLYEASANVAKAREQFSRVQQIATDKEQKSRAESHLASLDDRRMVYDANVDEAEDLLSGLLMTTMGISNEGAKHKGKLSRRQMRRASSHYKEAARATEKLPEPYVERTLREAREDLEAATELFPLGAEANELLALIYLQGNDWPAAYRSYDAVASQGFPVSFYAQVNSAKASKIVRAAKVEIGNDGMRLVYLTSYDPKRQTSEAPENPAGEDDLGNLVVSTAQPPDAEAEALTIHPADLKGIETKLNFVVLKLQNDDIYLAPLNMLSDAPFEGAASRSFGNEYTRLFIRYLGFESAKLGKEGMTGGEKFKLGFEIARIGVAVGAMGVGGAPVAYSSAMHMANLIHALQVAHTVGQGIRIASISGHALRLAGDLQTNVQSLERTSLDEEHAIQGMGFKIIPTQPYAMKYREKF